jgi:hypothetical protein
MNDEHFVDGLLGAPASGLTDMPLRETTLATTVRILRRQRRVRRMAMALALAGCYLAGVATVTFVRPATAEGDLARQTSNPDAAPVEVARPAGPLVDNQPPGTAILTAPRKSRTQFELLRDLGDANLLDRRDPESATRCYRMALRYATPDERAWAATEGTWLLRAVNQTFTTESKYDPAQPKTDARS